MVEVVKQTESSPLISVPKPRIGADVYSTKPCDSEREDADSVTGCYSILVLRILSAWIKPHKNQIK